MAATKRSWRITIVTVLLALVFLAAGGSKLAAPRAHFEHFAHWGYPSWLVYGIGLVEAGGAVLILISAARFYGAALLACAMLGAIFTHIRAGEFTRLPVPIVLLVLAGLVAWFSRPSRPGPGRARSG